MTGSIPCPSPSRGIRAYWLVRPRIGIRFRRDGECFQYQMIPASHRNALVSRRHLRGLERTQEGTTHALLSGTDRKPEVSRRNVSSLRKLLSEIA